jgi:PKD repeat protein
MVHFKTELIPSRSNRDGISFTTKENIKMKTFLRLGFLICFLISIFYLQLKFDFHSEKTNPIPESHTGNLQIPFITNQGQIHESVKFYAQTFGGTVFVTENGEIVYHLPQSPEHENQEMGLVIQESFVGGEKQIIKGEGRSRTKVNFFKGRYWQTDVPSYHCVSLGEVYNGIELKLRASGNNVEKLFFVKPGGKPADIKIKLTGTDRIKINEAGELHVESEIGSVAFTKPIAYQLQGENKEYVEVAYALSDGANEYGFAVGDYDGERELVIDPLLASTFIGGSGDDGFYYTDVNIALDADGNVLVAGKTQSLDFPSSVGVIQTNHAGGGDGFVARLDQDLTTLISATFIGGSRLEEIRALALDDNGNIFIAGITESSDYPTVASSYDRSYNGGANGPYGSGDIFISKLSSDLTTMSASTFLGGASHECCESMALDGQGNVYVTGGTASTNFPMTAGAYDNSLTPGGTLGYDIYVSKFDNNLSTLFTSTFLGGSNDDFSEAIALDKNGNVYLSGWIISSNFPTTAGAFKQSFAGGAYDAFVSRFDPNLATLFASTFLGGSQWDFAYGMSLDAAGNVYVTGHTASTNFPVSQNAFDKNYSGSGGQGVGDDVFVSKFDGLLTKLLASTYLGGSAWENGYYMATDAQGNVYVTGTTSSTNFPTGPNAYDKTYDGGTPFAGDIFISRLNNDLSTLFASTYLGKKQKESTGALCIDSNQNILIAGSTASSDFPTTYSSYNEIYNGGAGDVFIVRLDSLLSLDPVQAKFHANPLTGHAPLTVQFTDSSTAIQPITYWKWDFNHDGIYDSQEQNPSWTFNDPGAYSVLLEVANGSASQKKLYRDLIHVFNGESALLFNGDKSKVTCPASASLNLQSQLTIEAKINPAGWGKAPNIGFGRIVDKKNFVLYLIGAHPTFNDHCLALQLTHADGTVSISTSAENSISLDTWQHVAITYDASINEVKMYINSTEQILTQTKAPSGMIADHSSIDFVIGNNAAASFGFDGVIDEVRFWNNVRSKSEIQGHINQYLNGNETGLVSYWKMNEGNGGVIKDFSNHQSDAAISGANWIQGAPANLPTAIGMNLPQEKIPDGFQLYSNYPNPFNSATTIQFRLPKNADVSIQIFNLTGELVRTISQGNKEAGFYSVVWDGTDNSGSRVSSGVYCFKMVAGSFSEAKKLILVK